MTCPRCGTLMNRHAEKPIKGTSSPQDEVLVSIHYCPGCGKVEAELETESGSSFPSRRE